MFIVKDADDEPSGEPRECVEVSATGLEQWAVFELMMTVDDMSRAVAALV